MREIVHIQVGQCGNQIGSKVRKVRLLVLAVPRSIGVADEENTPELAEQTMSLA